jgi:hypothetical protein
MMEERVFCVQWLGLFRSCDLAVTARSSSILDGQRQSDSRQVTRLLSLHFVARVLSLE